METKPLDRFWSALESLPGLAAVSMQWEALLGPEHALVGNFLQPRKELASSYPCPDPKHPGTLHTVVVHGPDDYVGICPDGCAPTKLSKSDITVYEVNRTRLSKAVATMLGVTFAETEVEGVPRTTRIGTYSPYAGFRFPVYLTMQVDGADFHGAVAGLVALNGDPFILVAPTREFCTPSCESLLATRKAVFLPLCETAAAGADGELAAVRPTEEILAGFHKAVLPDTTDDSAMSFFPTPPQAHWEDVRISFTDNHTVSIKVLSAQGVYHYAQMGMVNKKNGTPTVQWELLRAFSEGHGRLDWSSRRADRRNQKRRENLAKDLQEFFRIDGDPFQQEGNGWRARFAFGPDA